MADIFDVVADPTRRDVLGALREASGSDARELSVGQIVDKLGLTQPTVSKHLKVLRDHGLVTVREHGQHRYYRLDASPLQAVDDWLETYLITSEDDSGSGSPIASWAGADAGARVGRAISERTHAARTRTEAAIGKVRSAISR